MYGLGLVSSHEFVEAFYKSGDVKTRYTILKLTMFNTGPGGYPCLKGRAMEVRELMPAISALWRQGMTAGDVYHIAICEALTASCRMDSILSSHRELAKLPPLIGIEFTCETFKYLQQQLLVHNYNGDRLFNITFKAHCLAHCGIRGQTISPRLSWCYLGEDRMKLVRKIVHKKALIKMVRAMEYEYEHL